MARDNQGKTLRGKPSKQRKQRARWQAYFSKPLEQRLREKREKQAKLKKTDQGSTGQQQAEQQQALYQQAEQQQAPCQQAEQQQALYQQAEQQQTLCQQAEQQQTLCQQAEQQQALYQQAEQQQALCQQAEQQQAPCQQAEQQQAPGQKRKLLYQNPPDIVHDRNRKPIYRSRNLHAQQQSALGRTYEASRTTQQDRCEQVDNNATKRIQATASLLFSLPESGSEFSPSSSTTTSSKYTNDESEVRDAHDESEASDAHDEDKSMANASVSEIEAMQEPPDFRRRPEGLICQECTVNCAKPCPNCSRVWRKSHKEPRSLDHHFHHNGCRPKGSTPFRCDVCARWEHDAQTLVQHRCIYCDLCGKPHASREQLNFHKCVAKPQIDEGVNYTRAEVIASLKVAGIHLGCKRSDACLQLTFATRELLLLHADEVHQDYEKRLIQYSRPSYASIFGDQQATKITRSANIQVPQSKTRQSRDAKFKNLPKPSNTPTRAPLSTGTLDCPNCGLEQQIRAHRANCEKLDSRWPCPYCDDHFAMLQDFRAHVAAHHIEADMNRWSFLQPNTPFAIAILDRVSPTERFQDDLFESRIRMNSQVGSYFNHYNLALPTTTWFHAHWERHAPEPVIFDQELQLVDARSPLTKNIGREIASWLSYCEIFPKCQPLMFVSRLSGFTTNRETWVQLLEALKNIMLARGQTLSDVKFVFFDYTLLMTSPVVVIYDQKEYRCVETDGQEIQQGLSTHWGSSQTRLGASRGQWIVHRWYKEWLFRQALSEAPKRGTTGWTSRPTGAVLAGL